MSVLALSMISQKFKLNFYKILMNANSFRGKEKAKKKKLTILRDLIFSNIGSTDSDL